LGDFYAIWEWIGDTVGGGVAGEWRGDKVGRGAAGEWIGDTVRGGVAEEWRGDTVGGGAAGEWIGDTVGGGVAGEWRGDKVGRGAAGEWIRDTVRGGVAEEWRGDTVGGGVAGEWIGDTVGGGAAETAVLFNPLLGAIINSALPFNKPQWLPRTRTRPPQWTGMLSCLLCVLHDTSALYVWLGWTANIQNTSSMWASLLEPTQKHTSPADVCQKKEQTNLTEPTPLV